MAWFKVDDRLWAHPKIMALPLTALGLWVKAGSYCAAYETDGALDRHMIGTLGAQKRDSDRLVEAGLWDETETGYVFHDWDQYQPTKAQLEAERSKARERMRSLRSGGSSGEQPSNVRANSGRSSGAPTRPDPTRPEVPNGTSKGGANRATQIPDTWQPKPGHHELAHELHVDVKSEAQKMRDWALSKGATGKDWDARFRNWLRRAAEINPPTRNTDRFDDWERAAQLVNTQHLRAIEGGTR